MKHYNHNPKTSKTGLKIGKTLGLYGGVALALASVIISDSIMTKKNYLQPRDFERAEWVMYDNQNGRIWSCYMNEDIPHNQTNWYAYQKEVRKANNDSLEGMISLPDLDRNGNVGK